MEPRTKRRQRIQLSCNECRRRKIRCDRNHPCSHCIATKSKCIFNFDNVETFPRQHLQVRRSSRASNSAAQPDIQALPTSAARSKVEPHQEQISGHQNDAPPTTWNNLPSTSINSGVQSPNISYSKHLEIKELQSRIQRLEKSSLSSPATFSDKDKDTQNESPRFQLSELLFDKTRSLGPSDAMQMPRQYELVLKCYLECLGCGKSDSFRDPETTALIAQMRTLLEDCKNTAKRIKTARPSRTLCQMDFGLDPPPKQLSDSMVRTYFASFESACRVLHVPTFWAEYQRYWYDLESAPTSVRLKVLLVISLGSSVHEDQTASAQIRYKVHQWVYAAQVWLSGPLEKDRQSVTGIQIYCLAFLARQIFSIGADMAWVSVGSLVHRAMQAGLHRDPSHLPGMSVFNAEIRRRLWATILELVLQSSLDTRMPPRLSIEEFDTRAPSNINDEEIDETTTILQPRLKEEYTAVSMQLLLLASFPTRLRTLQLKNSPNSNISYEETLHFSTDITDACRSCAKFLKDKDNLGVTPFHQGLMDYLVRRFLIWLHYTFAIKARENPVFYYSLKVCLDASIVIMSMERNERFWRLMIMGGGLFREGFRGATSIIPVELLAEVNSQRLDGSPSCNFQQITTLKSTAEGLVSLALERIRQGETNVKGYMFLSMIMSQIEAVESGSSQEVSIARGAVESLEIGLSLLRSQAGSLSSTNSEDQSPLSSQDQMQRFDLDFDIDSFSLLSDFPQIDFF